MLENHSRKSAYCILLLFQSILIDISYHNICRTGNHSHTVGYRKTTFLPGLFLFRHIDQTRIYIKLKRFSRFIKTLYSNKAAAYSHLRSGNSYPGCTVSLTVYNILFFNVSKQEERISFSDKSFAFRRRNKESS